MKSLVQFRCSSALSTVPALVVVVVVVFMHMSQPQRADRHSFNLPPAPLQPCQAELKLYSIILLIAFRWQATLVPRSPLGHLNRLPTTALNTSRFSCLPCKPCGKMRDWHTPADTTAPTSMIPRGELLVTSIVWDAENIAKSPAGKERKKKEKNY